MSKASSHSHAAQVALYAKSIPIEATRCDVCGAFSAGDECCGKGKPFATPFKPGGFPPVEPEKFFYAAWGGIPRDDRRPTRRRR